MFRKLMGSTLLIVGLVSFSLPVYETAEVTSYQLTVAAIYG